MSQIERLKQRKIELQQHWDDLSQKITSLRQDLAFETRSDERLRLRKNINQNEADRNQIGQELDNVEKELSNIANLEGSSSLETFIPTISSGIHEKPQSATSSMTQRSTVQLEPTAEVTQVKRSRPQVFLSYNKANEYLVEQLAQRLKGDARISFWFEPWHSIPGKTTLDEKEKVLLSAQSLAVFIGGNSAQLEKEWQSKEKDAAITIQVEDRSDFRVIPVLLPGPVRPNKSDLPPFLKLFNWVEFQTMDDEQAFKRLLAGILGIPPIEVEGYIETRRSEEIQREQVPSTDGFTQGHALIIGIANYPQLNPLPGVVLNDARDLSALLTDPNTCGYPQAQVVQLLDQDASANSIRTALVDLAQRTDVD
ncbi:MAG: TIR domain-containing protein, partial [Gammaproteobacteria bacterium]|nr:TIR domain-containing protein [Gammaproteobacteria bacterium]